MKWLGVLLSIGAVLVASQNPDENVGLNDPHLFEGDMILTADQRMAAAMGLDIDNPFGRSSTKNRQWPGGVVAYVIDSSLYRKYNFKKYSKSTIDSLGTSYDYGSVMHYGAKLSTRTDNLQSFPKQAGVKIGQRKGISATDAKQMNLLYKAQCSGGGNGGGGSNCVDTDKSCWDWTIYCSSNNYVKEHCKKTCNLC
ncbi:hypothetical protein OS493_008436 [Desmophyllum pertusum]|uniref:Metalloendopeptidase n=1 Tax=Desmophyllum pertusum TaxID=174260 RepID=A0A9X0DAU3_9CNID|nr:hypothetical protein OS493_008436 [Desmophyllum pertusum]